MKTITFSKRRLLNPTGCWNPWGTFYSPLIFLGILDRHRGEFFQLTLPGGIIIVTLYYVPILAYALFIIAYFNSHKQSWGASIILTIFQIGELMLRNTQWLSKVILMPIFTLVWQMLQLSFFPHYLMHSEDFSEKEMQLYGSRFNLSC